MLDDVYACSTVCMLLKFKFVLVSNRLSNYEVITAHIQVLCLSLLLKWFTVFVKHTEVVQVFWQLVSIRVVPDLTIWAGGILF